MRKHLLFSSVRRYLRYGVRALMLAVFAAAVCLSCFVRSARVQRDAVAEIAKAGGSVSYDSDHVDAEFQRRFMHKNEAPPAWQSWSISFFGVDLFRKVRGASLYEGASDAVMDKLMRLDGLEELAIAGEWVTDTTLAKIKGMANLRSLELDYTRVSDAGLVNLEALTALQAFSADDTDLGDAGICRAP